MFDVVVIGGGPIGSWVAYRLAASGHHTAVLEQRHAIGQKPCCTGIVSQECVNTFGISPEIIYRQEDCAKLYSPQGDSLHICRPETRVTILNRPAFDQNIADQAIASGAEYCLDARAEDITFNSNKAVVAIDHAGVKEYLETQAVVLASGFSSSIAKKIGFAPAKYFVAGAQTEAQGSDIAEIEIYLGQTLAPGFFGWIVPTCQGKCLIGLLTHHQAGFKLRRWLSRLAEQGKISSGEYQINYGGIPLKPLSRTFGDRLLIVGDAAGQVKPTTGGGLYFGLLCGDIAADILHRGFQKGDLTARSLSNYQRLWRKKLGHELRTEYYVRRFYELLSDRQINRIFSGIKSAHIADSLLQQKNVSFDRHGGLIFKALGLGMIAELKRYLHLPRDF